MMKYIMFLTVFFAAFTIQAADSSRGPVADQRVTDKPVDLARENNPEDNSDLRERIEVTRAKNPCDCCSSASCYWCFFIACIPCASAAQCCSDCCPRSSSENK